ncbi:hypothetical protein [Aliiroseovarius lamellibrachiae]|uniref:hypothetical protein n=1 Tax=Aliiroseovarius lamellibrachiae TaxID=1924933 RepID=UPI001BE03443|nr:hypothetical protein [Aliiroseovarius lamellibrachiae]MBT2131067.1 hypothetical protein [Aliiroseovarius lamellibrachiae]
MGFLLFAAIYFCLGGWLGLSRLSVAKVVLSAVILLAIGAFFIGGLSVLSKTVLSFGPVIGFAAALGRTIRHMRKGR